MTAPRVLVVEDSATQALQLRHALEGAGLTVEWVQSADAALASLDRALPDLVLTDYRLPGALGDELCRKIRMNVSTRGIPVLMLTSEGEEALERHVLESGADDYVPKSQDIDFVLLRVQALMRKARVQTLALRAEGGLRPAKLLVVDDSPTYQALIAGELEQAGYRVATAATGTAALERLALEAFDGVLVDLALPDMNGVELCRRIVESRRTVDHAYCILALTGSATRDNVTALLEAGADDVVAKSRDITVVKARLGALIRRTRLYEENRRIAEEFRARELEVLRAHAQREAAEVRAALADELARANRELK